jgi:hypothetical protein
MKKLELNKTKMSTFKEGLNNLITQFFGESSEEVAPEENNCRSYLMLMELYQSRTSIRSRCSGVKS